MGTAAGIYAISVTIIAIITMSLSIRFRKQRDNARSDAAFFRATCDTWETEFNKLTGISQNFINSCRLVAIHRDGRLNVFTFSRDNKIFAIETMGLLSDIPDDWCIQAGLK